MLTVTTPVLSDGTSLTELFSPDRNEVSLRLLSDPEIYRLEMDRVFAKTWQLLGHVTELPDPGDYVVRFMADDQVIVARGRDGGIHVSLNVCPHRGMRICTAEAGNAQIHRCIYHGWAFRPDGSFIGAPIEREKMHGEIYSKDQLGLKQARVAIYGGMIFATWNIEGPSFDEFLGDMKWYLDTIFERTPGGLEAAGPPQRFILNANWKAPGEQSACDSFHTLTLHRSLMEGGVMGTVNIEEIYAAAPGMFGIDIATPAGHTMRCIPGETTFTQISGIGGLASMSVEERLKILPPPGIAPEMVESMKARLSPRQLELLAKAPPQIANLFPNVLILFLYAPRDDGGYSGALAIHAYVPRDIDHVEFINWVLVEKDAPEQMKRDMIANSIRAMGTSGTIEQDDSDTWPHISAVAKNGQGARQTMKYQAIAGESRPAGWAGPGQVHDGFSKDDTQWSWWQGYRRLMLSVD